MGKYIADAIHKFLYFEDDEMKVIDHPLFQRLRKIRQLSNAYIVYPCANHTRFEHSLGVGYLAGLVGKQLSLEDYEVKVLRVAGILHDIGHGPFGHTLEPILIEELGMNHEEFGVEVIRENFSELLEGIGIETKDVCNAILGRGFLGKVIGGGKEKGTRISVDVDHMDYLKRDNYFCGVEVGSFSTEYLLINLVKIGGEICLNRKAIGEVHKIINMRVELGREVYFHKTKLIADHMILRACWNTVQNGVDPREFWMMGDEEAKMFFRKFEENKELVKALDERRLYKIGVMAKLEGYGIGMKDVEVKYIGEEEYNRIARMSLKEIYEIEESIRRDLGFDVLIIRTPPFEFREVESDILIWDGERVHKYEDVVGFENILRMNKEIAMIGVAARPENRKKLHELEIMEYF